MSEEARECPYCGEMLSRPYWHHIQENHPQEYAKHETWISLYKDYSSMGMDQSICFMVIAELFNSTPDQVKSFLKKNNAL
ncbi:MAG: hypothetical protein JW891_12880 [Candidatus Lokiarchaeota archaeon]|nr:hypothetical protein [Candidatus Lokiarchaeota archaeon]